MAEEAKLKVMKCDFKMHTSVKNKITQYLIVKKKQAYKREEIKTQTGCKKGGIINIISAKIVVKIHGLRVFLPNRTSNPDIC